MLRWRHRSRKIKYEWEFILSHFCTCNPSCDCMTNYPFLVDGDLGLFPFRKTLLNKTREHSWFLVNICNNSLGHIPRSCNCWVMGSRHIEFLVEAAKKELSIVIWKMYSSGSNACTHPLFTSSLLDIVSFFQLGQTDCCVTTLDCFNLDFLRTSKVIHFFKYLFAILIFLFLECLFVSFIPLPVSLDCLPFTYWFQRLFTDFACFLGSSAHKAGGPGSSCGVHIILHISSGSDTFLSLILPSTSIEFHSMNGIWWTEINFNVVNLSTFLFHRCFLYATE